MDKNLLIGGVIGAVVVTAGGAIAGFGLLNDDAQYAEVLQVTELTETVAVPRQVCEEVAVTRQEPVKDDKRIIGTVTGAVVGGLVGNQIGGGSGKKIATIAGAAAGGYGGNKVQEQMQKNNTTTTTESRCSTVNDTRQEHIGYEVRYRLDGEEGVVRMDRDPGERIPVRNGELVLDPAA